MKHWIRALPVLAMAAVIGALVACGGDDSAAEPAADSSEQPAETAAPPAGDGQDGTSRQLAAPIAAITVDGDTLDWDGIEALGVTLEPIVAVDGVEAKEASVKVAHDEEFVYVLFEVVDDYNWSAEDAHLSAASAVMWNIDPGAGPHMGADDESGAPGLGAVDIWHWELECALGEQHGGAVSDPGDGDPGNDGGCNFDDEVAASAFERDDDNTAGAENSLLGVWTHTDPTDDAPGTWVFEAQRPLQTGDAGDAQLAVGATAQLALAYWDADNSVEGWSDAEHVQSSNQGWIDVALAG